MSSFYIKLCSSTTTFKARECVGRSSIWIIFSILFSQIIFTTAIFHALLDKLNDGSSNRDITILCVVLFSSTIIGIALLMRLLKDFFTTKHYIFNQNEIIYFERIWGFVRCYKTHSLNECQAFLAKCQASNPSGIFHVGGSSARVFTLYPKTYDIYIKTQAQIHILFSTCYKSVAVEFLENLKHVYPNISEITEQGFVVNSSHERFPNEATVAITHTKRLQRVKRDLALAGFIFPLLAALLCGILILSPWQQLEDLPSKNNWVKVENYLAKSSLGSNTPQAYLVYQWKGKAYKSPERNLDNMLDDKNKDGSYPLYINPRNPSESAYEIPSRNSLLIDFFLLAASSLALLIFSIYMLKIRIKLGRKYSLES